MGTYTYKLLPERLCEEDRQYYNRRYNGLTATGELIQKTYDAGQDLGKDVITKVVFKGSWTPCGAIRDCGDHYIEALYSSYKWISKDGTTIIYDVEDN